MACCENINLQPNLVHEYVWHAHGTRVINIYALNIKTKGVTFFTGIVNMLYSVNMWLVGSGLLLLLLCLKVCTKYTLIGSGNAFFTIRTT